MQKPGLHRQDPEVTPPFMSVLVDNVAAIGRPSSTAQASGGLLLRRTWRPEPSALASSIEIGRWAGGRDLLGALSDEERSTLTALLERVAKKQGLQEGVHPGYRNLSEPLRGNQPERRQRQDLTVKCRFARPESNHRRVPRYNKWSFQVT
ncbi:MAG TPA: hypothetical protein VK638_55145 [Edaphobacter sp.]|nr:hypothetical protein [Edaphobacter sp.]